MAYWNWSKVATNNNTSDPTMNWSEGIPPSIVDDNVRALMARSAEQRDDVSGSVTSAGTPPTYTLTTNQGLQTPTPVTGQYIGWSPNATNAGADTIAVDGGNAYAILSAAGTPVGAGVLVAGSPYQMMFNGLAWKLCNFYGQPFTVPIGGMIDWTGTSPPNSNFVFPFGQQISQTTYAALYALYGANRYGADGGGLFFLPDVRGRCTYGVDNMGGSAAGRIGSVATDNGTIVGTTLGSTGGSATHVQTSSEMAQHNHTGSGNVSDPGHAHVEQASSTSGSSSSISIFNAVNTAFPISMGLSTQSSTTGVTVPSLNINNSGGNAAMSLLPPGIMMNKLLRIL